MRPTQIDKIINLCRDGQWRCQSEFWQISHSPHKRRSDIEEEGIWKFEDRPCEHGIKGSRDYRMCLAPDAPAESVQTEARKSCTLCDHKGWVIVVRDGEPVAKQCECQIMGVMTRGV